MGTIRNTSKGDIQVTTEAGKFVFPAGKDRGEFAAERIAEIEKAGAVYFTAGELVTVADETPTDKPDAEDDDKPKGRKK